VFLREIAYGQWEGKSPEDVNREFHDAYVRWLADLGWNAPTGGERGIDTARRSSLVIEEIEQTCDAGNVLVVSHKATTRIMLCSLLGIDVGRFCDCISMPVASIGIVEMAVTVPCYTSWANGPHEITRQSCVPVRRGQYRLERMHVAVADDRQENSKRSAAMALSESKNAIVAAAMKAESKYSSTQTGEQKVPSP
jgi:hypothetical protein